MEEEILDPNREYVNGLLNRKAEVVIDAITFEIEINETLPPFRGIKIIRRDGTVLRHFEQTSSIRKDDYTIFYGNWGQVAVMNKSKVECFFFKVLPWLVDNYRSNKIFWFGLDLEDKRIKLHTRSKYLEFMRYELTKEVPQDYFEITAKENEMLY